MAVRTCPNCGGKVAMSRNTCPHCGHEFKETKTCPECEEQVDFDVKECPICGHIFEEEVKEEKVETAPVVAPVSVADKVSNDVDNNKVEKANNDNIKTNIVGIRCPHCGSNEVIQLNEDNHQCQVCDSTFMVDKGPDTVVNGDIIINNGPKVIDGSEFTEGYKLVKNLSEKDFKQALYKSLLESASTPSDIFNAKFENVELIDVDYIFLRGSSTITYSRTLGFDRKEPYTDYETKRDSQGNSYKVPVTKYRTVTDWRPDNGQAYGNATAFVHNCSSDTRNRFFEACALRKCLADAPDELLIPFSSEEIANKLPSSKAVDEAEDNVIRSIYRKEVPRSGDHIKDERYNGQVSIESLELIRIPVFKINYSLRGDSYTMYASACHKAEPYFIGEQKYKEYSSDASKRNAINVWRDKHSKIAKGVFIPGIILIILSIILGIALGSWILFLILMGAGIGLLVTGLVLRHKWSNDARDMEYNLARKIKNAKKDGYERMMKALSTNCEVFP